jgi:hypothetical protein
MVFGRRKQVRIVDVFDFTHFTKNRLKQTTPVSFNRIYVARTRKGQVGKGSFR